VHPPKADAPADSPDPGEQYPDVHISVAADLKTERIEVIA
jgi:hypothetical protein